MQAALCNTRVFTARTQTRTASRRSVRVQAADRTLWLPGEGLRGTASPARPGTPRSRRFPRARPPSSSICTPRAAHPQRRWAASRVASAGAARRWVGPTHAPRAPPSPSRCLQASRPPSTWMASWLAVSAAALRSAMCRGCRKHRWDRNPPLPSVRHVPLAPTAVDSGALPLTVPSPLPGCLQTMALVSCAEPGTCRGQRCGRCTGAADVCDGQPAACGRRHLRQQSAACHAWRTAAAAG